MENGSLSASHRRRLDSLPPAAPGEPSPDCPVYRHIKLWRTCRDAGRGHRRRGAGDADLLRRAARAPVGQRGVARPVVMATPTAAPPAAASAAAAAPSEEEAYAAEVLDCLREEFKKDLEQSTVVEKLRAIEERLRKNGKLIQRNHALRGQREHSDQLGETGTRATRKEVEKRFVHYCYVCDKFVIGKWQTHRTRPQLVAFDRLRGVAPGETRQCHLRQTRVCLRWLCPSRAVLK